MGTKLSYGCPSEWVFAHNWYQNPKITMTCKDTGEFDPPDEWPLCVDRKFFSLTPKY